MNVALEIAKVVATAIGGEAWQKCVCRAIASNKSKTAWRRLRLAAVNTTA